MVQYEAISNYSKNKWLFFLSILTLSTVVNRRIETLSLDLGQNKYKFLFNQLINPRVLDYDISLTSIFILFSWVGHFTGEFQPNHFVPIISIFRINEVNKQELIKQHHLSDSSLDKKPNKKFKRSVFQPWLTLFLENDYKTLFVSSASTLTAFSVSVTKL